MNRREAGRAILWLAAGAAIVAVPILLLRREPQLHLDPVTIRSYAVAPEIAGEVEAALTDAFSAGPWRVSHPAGGLLLVSAPDSVQSGVQGILAQIAAKKPPPTPAMRFEIWLVSAAPGAASKTDTGAGLVEVRTALAAIQKSQGPLHFDVLEKLALQARAGSEDSEIEGAHFGLRVTPTLRHDAKGDPVIAAKIYVHAYTPNCSGSRCPGSLNALAELPPGQLLVIGQSGLPSNPNTDTASASEVYYIVRASL